MVVYSTPLLGAAVIFNVTRKKYPKFSALSRSNNRSGNMSTVSTRLCPEFRKSCLFL